MPIGVQSKLKDLCKTRWTKRDAATVRKANGFLPNICTFELLISSSIAMRLQSSLRSLTVKLQKQSKNILQAYDQVSDVQLELERMKENCEEEFHL